MIIKEKEEGNVRKSRYQAYSHLRISSINYKTTKDLFSPISPMKKATSFDGKKKLQIKFSKKLTLEQFSENLKFILKYFHSNSQTGYQGKVLQLFKQKWQNYRVKLNERFNFIMYLEPTLKYKSYSQIEIQVMKQWQKQDYFLQQLLIIWMNCLLETNFENPEQFQTELQNQKGFITELSYATFIPYFSVLIQKQFPVMDRLNEETSLFIITSHQNWKRVNDEIIQKIYNENTNQQIDFNFDIRTLQLGNHVLNNQNKQQYSKTIQCIRKQSSETRVLEKIKLFRKMRKYLEEEIREHQASYQQSFTIIQKDDFIGLLIYCIVTGKIQNILNSIRYFQIILGPHYNQVLSRWQVDSYRADLQSAVCYLLENSLANQRDIDL